MKLAREDLVQRLDKVSAFTVVLYRDGNGGLYRTRDQSIPPVQLLPKGQKHGARLHCCGSDAARRVGTA